MRGIFFSPSAIAPDGVWSAGRCRVAWRLNAAASPGAALRSVTPCDMEDCRAEWENSSVRIVWKGHPEMGCAFTVEVCWSMRPDGCAEGTISYAGNASGNAVESIEFPLVEFAPSPEDRFCSAGMFGGMMEPLPAQGEMHRRLTGLQLLAVVNTERSGCYMDARDPDQRGKIGILRASSATVTQLGIDHYVPLCAATKEAYALPYPVSFAEHRGDWYEAAMLYRPWALKQKWFTARRKNPRLRDIGLWFWNRGASGMVMDPVERAARDSGVPVALDWYWWHHNPYDTGYPDFWHPREGDAVFRAAVERMNRAGIYTQVYVNGMAWDLDTPSYREGGDGSVVVNRDGTPYSVVYNVYTKHRLGHMCGEAPSFQDRLSGLVKKLTESGLPGVYLDMIGCCFHSCCFNPAHQHDPCGGDYGRRGFAEMVERYRRENPGTQFSTESPSEMQDIFDSMITLGTSIERCGGGEAVPIPLYQAVYHGEGVTVFGSYALVDAIPPWDPLWPDAQRFRQEKDWHRLYPEQFFVELSRCVVFGIQPCVCNLRMDHIENPAFAEEYRFVLETARFYHANLAFLYDGRMLSPGKLECEMRDVGFIARGIFVTEETCKFPVKKMPVLLHGVWESPAGEKRLFLANYTNVEQAFRFAGPDGAVEGTVDPYAYKSFALK